MHYIDRYPIVVTAEMVPCRDFWVRHLGFTVFFENDWFVYLQADGASMGFMLPDHPSTPPGPEAYEAGISMELEVLDAAAALAEVEATGLVPDYPLTVEPYGQRRFRLARSVRSVDQCHRAGGTLMAGALKITPYRDYFGLALAEELADDVCVVFPAFERRAFLRQIAAEIEPLGLKGRVALIAAALREYLPGSYPRALEILVAIFGPENPGVSGAFTFGRRLMPVGSFIERTVSSISIYR